MTLFSLQVSLGNEHWEVNIADFQFFEIRVQKILDLLPNKIRIRFQNITPGNIVIIDHIGFGDDLFVPFGEMGCFIELDFILGDSFFVFFFIFFCFLFGFFRDLGDVFHV